MDAELSTEILPIKIEEMKGFTIAKLFSKLFILYIKIFIHMNSINKIRIIDWQSFTPDINAIENI